MAVEVCGVRVVVDQLDGGALYATAREIPELVIVGRTSSEVLDRMTAEIAAVRSLRVGEGS